MAYHYPLKYSGNLPLNFRLQQLQTFSCTQLFAHISCLARLHQSRKKYEHLSNLLNIITPCLCAAMRPSSLATPAGKICLKPLSRWNLRIFQQQLFSQSFCTFLFFPSQNSSPSYNWSKLLEITGGLIHDYHAFTWQIIIPKGEVFRSNLIYSYDAWISG